MTSVRIQSLRLFGLTFAFVLLLAADGWAGGAPSTFNVNTVADEVDVNTADGNCVTATGKCSLRAAVMQANQLTNPTTIVVPQGTYALTIPPSGGNGAESGDLNLTTGADVVTISGAGAATTVIDADQINDRVFLVHSSRTANISGVALRNGTAASGGIIQNQGALTVSYCRLEGGTATNGGAIFATGGSVTLSDSTVSGNQAADEGGGVYNISPSFHLDRSTISDNEGFVGGAIYDHSGGTMFLMNSTISGNRSLDSGGGIYVDGTVWTYNATIVFNTANWDEDFDGEGGGVFVNLGASFYPRNSVIAGNTVSKEGNWDCVGTAGIFGTNWFGTTAGCTIVPQTKTAWHSTVNSLAELGPLRFNGGSTRTHALQAGSAMIDTGFACISLGDPPVDQRGGAREPVLPDQLCDAGAFEYNALPAGLIFSDGFELGNFWAWG